MSNQSYEKEYNFCKAKIVMSQRLGRWYPSDLDGGIHRCEAKRQQSKQEPKKPELKNLLEAQLMLEGMNARLKRVEKMLFQEGQ